MESPKKQKIFNINISRSAVGNNIQYSGCMKDKTISKYDLTELLREIANERILNPYSTFTVFGGKDCTQEDIDSIHSHFERNSNVEFVYFDKQLHNCDFIIAAY